MIQIRFIKLFMAATAFLGVHTMYISNQTSTPTVAIQPGSNFTKTRMIRPYYPQSELHRHAIERVGDEKPSLYPCDSSPTPAPTGRSSPSTTVHITDVSNFAILLPRQGSKSTIGDSETNAQSYCFGRDGCDGLPMLAQGFITAASVSTGGSGGMKYIQVTGCINATVMGLSTSDEGGQYDVRFPNGAKCAFGGFGASFIEQVEPASARFCLRCCSDAGDQTSCNSHNDEAGCVRAIPGTYDFPEQGVSCG